MDKSLSRAVLRLHEKITGRKILERLDELNRTQWLSREELVTLQREKLEGLIGTIY